MDHNYESVQEVELLWPSLIEKQVHLGGIDYSSRQYFDMTTTFTQSSCYWLWYVPMLLKAASLYISRQCCVITVIYHKMLLFEVWITLHVN